jgi:hypothetical protein
VGEFVHLGGEHEASILDFLSRDPIENVMMIGLILEDGLPGDGYREFVGYRENGAWLAVACFSGDITLYAPDERAITPMAEYALRRVPMVPRIISRKDTVDRFWETFRRAPYPIQFDRLQWVYLLDPPDLKVQGPGQTRLARLDEVEAVAKLASAMSMEEIQMDPLRDHRASYLRLIARRIQLQRYYVLEDEGEIKFQVHLNAITPDAGQVTGVYTPPQFRRQGWALQGMADFCKLALERAPRLCLFVNDFNTPAINLYEALGFRRDIPYRAIFLKSHF